MDLRPLCLYEKRAGYPFYGSMLQLFLLSVCPWNGKYGTGKFSSRDTGIYLGDPVGVRKRYSGAAYGSRYLRWDKTDRQSSRIPVASGFRDLYFIFPAGTFIMRRPYTRCILRIFQSAFGIRQVSGGIAGFGISKSIRYGISRGVFSNEAGLGTLAVPHGPAEHTSPEEQGMWAMFEVFFDTVVLCSLTALVILCTTQGDTETLSLTGAALAAACFLQNWES